MSEPQTDNEKKFRVALETRNLEIGLLWQRSLFFWGFIAAAFVGYGDIVKEKDHDAGLAAAVASFGLICSVAWTLANRGSKYWQESWENKLKETDTRGLKTELFITPYAPPDLRWWGQWSRTRHFSVSRLAMALSDFTVAVWTVLILRAVPSPRWLWYLDDHVVYAIPVATILYAVVMVWGTRTSGSTTVIPQDEVEPKALV